MKRTLFLAAALGCLLPLSAHAVTSETASPEGIRHSKDVPSQLSENERAGYRAIFDAIRGEQWEDAKSRILALNAGDMLRPFSLAEFYLAKNSPKVELFDLMDLLSKAPWLPQAEQLKRLAQKRGAQILPDLPQVQKLAWFPGAPRRKTLDTVATDAAGQALGQKILPLIKADDPAAAEALLNDAEATLTPEGLAEWRTRIAWSYYIENDDANARRVAEKAQGGAGPWAVHSHWVAALAAWRQNDCRAAAPSFANLAALSSGDDMRAAGLYWAARSYMVCGEPQKVENLLKAAAKLDETFYGMLARETLGMGQRVSPIAAGFSDQDWNALKQSPNIRAAIALVEVGRDDLADKALRQQALLSGGRDHEALLRLAQALNLPATQIWLAHNGPEGAHPDASARFPVPNWTPDGGWRVDKALVFAHTLQESGFRSNAVSGAGARGLMQVLPGTAQIMASRDGTNVEANQLSLPSTNMEYGQRYLEKLRDMNATGGLLPKVMAAYNAGPLPVQRWNSEVHDNGDPLLFMESLPYYETRAYVNIVMRNYWIYQRQVGEKTESLTGLAQGLWPKFPGMSGASAVRISANVRALSSAD